MTDCRLDGINPFTSTAPSRPRYLLSQPYFNTVAIAVRSQFAFWMGTNTETICWCCGVRYGKLLLRMPASRIRVLVGVPAILFLTQLPAKAPGELVEHGPSSSYERPGWSSKIPASAWPNPSCCTLWREPADERSVCVSVSLSLCL